MFKKAVALCVIERPPAVLVIRTSPLLCRNVPPVLRNEAPMVVVPVGKVTVPVAIVIEPLRASVEVLNDQLPPTPVNVKLLKAEVPRAITAELVPIKVTEPPCGINAFALVQFLKTLILNPEPEALRVSSAPMVTLSAPTLPLRETVLAVPSITTLPIFVLVVAILASPHKLLTVPLKVVVAIPVTLPLKPRTRLPAREIDEVPRASVPKFTFRFPVSISGLVRFQVEAPLLSPNVTLWKKYEVVALVSVELEVVAVNIIVERSVLKVAS